MKAHCEFSEIAKPRQSPAAPMSPELSPMTRAENRAYARRTRMTTQRTGLARWDVCTSGATRWRVASADQWRRACAPTFYAREQWPVADRPQWRQLPPNPGTHACGSRADALRCAPHGARTSRALCARGPEACARGARPERVRVRAPRFDGSCMARRARGWRGRLARGWGERLARARRARIGMRQTGAAARGGAGGWGGAPWRRCRAGATGSGAGSARSWSYR